MQKDLESRLDDLEIKYTHQEELLTQLNKIVANQSLILEKMARELSEIKLGSMNSQDSISNEKPPHY